MKNFNNADETIINLCNEKKEDKFSKYFKRDSIVDLITKYELYYHISLGNFVFETFLDQEETSKKLAELNLYITPDMAMFNIYKIIEENACNKNFKNEFESKIRKTAALQALNDFITKDKELLNIKYYKNQKEKNILSDSFFNELMKYNFESNYQKTYEHYNIIVNDKFVENIPNLISQTANKEVF